MPKQFIPASNEDFTKWTLEIFTHLSKKHNVSLDKLAPAIKDWEDLKSDMIAHECSVCGAIEKQADPLS